MNADYESVRWFTELCYNLFRFSDGVMIWVVLLSVFVMVVYSAVCVLLIPFSVIHRVITDRRQDRPSIRHILTAILYCYPVLLPWAWNCKSEHVYLRVVYYVAINIIWFLVLGLGSIGLIAQIHDSAVNNDEIPLSVYEFIRFVIIANLTFVYSIGLLVWKHRFDSRQNERTQVQDSIKIYFHSSVMFSLWLVMLILVYFSGLWEGAVNVIWFAYYVTLAWIVVSFYSMASKEIRFRRELSNFEA